MYAFFFVSAGAVLGANLRFWVGLWATQRLGGTFPYGTLIVNVVGCFLAGLFYGFAGQRVAVAPELKLFFVVGFLGAFTTFSTFGYDSLALLRNQSWTLLAFNLASNNLLGLLAVWGGLTLARLFTPLR